MHLLIFFSFLFFLLGILSGTYTPCLLLLAVFPSFYLFFVKQVKRAQLVLLSFLLIGFLISYFYPQGEKEATSLNGIVVYRKESYYLIWTWKGKYLVFSRDRMPLPLFSVLTLQGKTKPALFSHHESGFDFGGYLKSHGVSLLFEPKNTIVRFRIDFSPEMLKDHCFQHLEKEGRALASSLLFGDSLYALESYPMFQSLGLASILTLSGFHLSFFFLCLRRLLGRSRERFFDPLCFLLLFFFLFLSDFRFSLRRIFLLFLLDLINRRAQLNLTYLDRVSLISTLMLLLEPYAIRSASFYYSFPLLFSLALFQDSRKKKKGRFLLYLFTFFLPLRLSSQFEFSVFSPLLQLVLIPYTHLLFLSGLLLFFIPPFGYLYSFLIQGLIKAVAFGDNYRFSLISGKPSWVFLIVYYLLIFLIWLLENYAFRKQSKVLKSALILSTGLLFVPDFFPHQEVDFIDVNQGDSTLIRYQRANILIDTGGNIKEDYATTCLIPYFYKKKIRKLDAVLITHLDYDHYGALASLKAHFPIGQICYGEDFLDKEDDTLTFQGLSIRNLNHYQDKTDSNSTSAVFQFTISDRKFLIMGDAPIAIEKKILQEEVNLKADYLKVGHHGSATSSSSAFLQAVSPQMAIISCGYQNSYGHPHPSTLANLKALKIPYRRTDLEGTIEIQFRPFRFFPIR